MQNDKRKVREYKVLLGAISLFAGLFSFYFMPMDRGPSKSHSG
jgi:hypothetical protein